MIDNKRHIQTEFLGDFATDLIGAFQSSFWYCCYLFEFIKVKTQSHFVKNLINTCLGIIGVHPVKLKSVTVCA